MPRSEAVALRDCFIASPSTWSSVCVTRPTLLVADDSPEWRSVISQFLESEYELIAQADRGDQIVGLAKVYRPDAITLDVSMPGISGLNVLSALRAVLPATVVVMVTTQSDPHCVQEAYLRGADAYVLKNRVLSELLPALQAGRQQYGPGYSASRQSVFTLPKPFPI